MISKYMTAITDKKLRDKMMKEKTLEMKEAIELIRHNTYEKKNKENTIPEALITTKEKQLIKEEPIQRIEKFGNRTKSKMTGTRQCSFATARIGVHKCPALESNCNNCGKKGHHARAWRQKQINNRTVKKLTEVTANETNESLSESDESIYHIEEKRTSKKNRNITQRK